MFNILQIFQFWTYPNLWIAPSFWYRNEVTPKGFRLFCLCGICIVFDKPEKSI
jgi:hypothetical protein